MPNINTICSVSHTGLLAGQNAIRHLKHLTFRTNYRIQRDFGQKTERPKNRQGEKERKRQRDEICGDEDCLTIKNGRIVKRRDESKVNNVNLLKNEDYDPTLDLYTPRPREPDLKTIVNLNVKIRKRIKDLATNEIHSMNKLKPWAVKPKKEKKPENKPIIPGKSLNVPKLKTPKRWYSTTKKISTRYELKKNEFKPTAYEEAPPRDHTMYPYFVDKAREAEMRRRHEERYPFPTLRKKEASPLFSIVKEMSEKSKTGKSFVYKVCNDNTGLKMKNKPKYMTQPVQKPATLEVVKCNEPKLCKVEDKLPKLIAKTRENFLITRDRSKEKIINFYSFNSSNVTVDEEYKEKVARTLRYLLQPVIEQEYMKYSELKAGKF